MKNQIKSVVINLINEFEEQNEFATLSQLQKAMFLYQTIISKNLMNFSIFNYGPYSLELESLLDELLVEREIDRYGSFFRVLKNIPYTEDDFIVSEVVSLLKCMHPNEMQKACTVIYYKNKYDNDTCAFESAQKVTPRGTIEEFQNAFSFLSGQLSNFAT